MSFCSNDLAVASFYFSSSCPSGRAEMKNGAKIFPAERRIIFSFYRSRKATGSLPDVALTTARCAPFSIRMIARPL